MKNKRHITRALVTGASGFIGGHLCQRLVRSGIQVHGISRSTKTADNSQIHWHQVDLLDRDAIDSVVPAIKPDVIFHLASEVTGSRDLSAVIPTYENIVTSSINILHATQKHGVARIILTGSLEESGSDQITVRSPYAAAKKTSTLYANMFYELYKTPVVLLRLGMVYGPHQKDMKKLVPYTISSMITHSPLSFSSGTRSVDWIYIDDVVDALIQSGQAPDLEGKTFEIGTGVVTSIRDVVTQIAKHMKYTKELGFGKLPDRQFDEVFVAQTISAGKYLHWKAKTSMTKGLASTIKWYTKNI